MKIKTKLTLGVGLLFLLIILLGVVGIAYINALKQDTDNILEANYNTLQYSRNMLMSLDENTETSILKFELNLQKQERNITEVGEREATRRLRNTFEAFKSNTADSSAQGVIRKAVFKIMDMNMQAIQRKSDVANKAADNAVFWIAITGSLCLLIAFVLLVNLPSNIADPIKELSDSIKQIAAKNYSERVRFEKHGEFGQLARSFNIMAEKLEEYNNSNLAKLMMEKKRIETLIDSMHDPVIGLDEKLHVIFANEAANKVIGLVDNTLIGSHINDLALKNDLIRTLALDITSESTVQQKNIKIYTDGKEGYFEKETFHIAIAPTGEQSKRLVGHVIILRNVTEYKELDFAKTRFIATVSHEFKTPISSIKMSLQLLENKGIGRLNDEQKQLLESIKDDAGRLLKITGELLNMTQAESGNIQLSILPVDPKGILLYAVNATKTQADQKQVKLEMDLPRYIPKVLADSEKTAWVLTNLISNAIRYSYDDATVYLTLEVQHKKVLIAVRDTGQGIAPQYKDRIFDRYFRIPGTKKEGTGLGLAISKEFMEAQGGSISVDSDFGSGSTFTITLNRIFEAALM